MTLTRADWDEVLLELTETLATAGVGDVHADEGAAGVKSGGLVTSCGYTHVDSSRTQAARRRLRASGRRRKTRGSTSVAGRRRNDNGLFHTASAGMGR